MPMEQNLKLSGSLNGQVRLWQEPGVLRAALWLGAPLTFPAALYLLDGQNSQPPLLAGHLSPGQRSWEGAFSPAPVFADRAGLAIFRDDVPVARAFPKGLPQQKPSPSLPPFETLFASPKRVVFRPTQIHKLPFSHPLAKTALEHPSTRHCITSYGGFYHALHEKSFLILAVPCQLGQDPLPFLPWFPCCNPLFPLEPGHWGCVLLGVHLEENVFFPVVFE